MMTLDHDLENIRQKLDDTEESGEQSALTRRERRILADALGDAQHRRDGGDPIAPAGALQTTRLRSELDFFFVCLGYCLVGFALIAALRWTGGAPLGRAGIFGLAFLAGLCIAALRAYYIGTWQPRQAARLMLAAAGACLIFAFFSLAAIGAIGGAAGIVAGVIFFQAVVRSRRHHGASTATDTAAPVKAAS